MDYPGLLLLFQVRKKAEAVEKLNLWDKHALKECVFNHQKSVLHLACSRGWQSVCRRLIQEYNLDPSFVDSHGSTILHMACRSGNTNLVNYLIDEFKFNPFQTNNDGHTALHSAVMAGSKGVQLVYYLISECSCDLICKTNDSVVDLAFSFWNRHVIKCLICKGGCDVFVDSGDDTILHKFCAEGDVKSLKFLLEECNCDPNVQDKKGDTLLHKLCYMTAQQKAGFDPTALMDYLIMSCKCNPNIANASGNTMLDVLSHSLLKNGCNNITSCKMLCHLIMKCDMFRIELNNELREKLLQLVCDIIHQGYYNFLSLSALSNLILTLNTNPNVILANGGGSVLHILCKGVYSGPQSHVIDLISFLVTAEYGCDIFQTNNHGYTALHMTVKNGSKCLAVVKYLVKIYAHHRNCEFDAAKLMKIALQFWDRQIIKCLISEGGYQVMLDNGSTLLHALCRKKDIENLKFMLEQCACTPDIQDECGNTILHEICIMLIEKIDTHLIQFVEYLVTKHKCNISLTNNDGLTVIHLSVMIRGSHSLIQYFIRKCDGDNHVCKKYRASIMTLAYQHWSRDRVKYLLQVGHCGLVINNGSTILHEHCRNGNIECVKFLLEECKSDCNIRDKNGDTILHLICSLRQQSVFYHIDFFRYLISRYKCNPSLKNRNGDTVFDILHQSLYSNDFKSIDCKLFCYAITHSKFTKNDCSFLIALCNTIHRADYNNCDILMLSAMRQLIEGGSNPHHIRLDNGDTILHILCNAIDRWEHQIYHILDFFLYLVKECECDSNITVGGKPLVNALCKHAYNPQIIELLNVLIMSCKCQFDPNDRLFFILLFNAIGHDSDMALDMLYYITESRDVEIINNAVFTFCCLEHYSSRLIEVFQYFFDECNYDVQSANENGNTPLHLACLYYNGDTSLIEYILSVKGDPLCLNKNNQTPLDLLKLKEKSLSKRSMTDAIKVISRFGEVKMSHPIESYVNVAVLGNPGVGKSSLVKVIIDRSNSIFWQRFMHMQVTEVEFLTAGVVPHVMKNCRDLGSIILHDFAGHAEYYSSHTAVLTHLLQGHLPPVFIIVVSLIDPNCIDSLHLWLSIIKDICCKSLKKSHIVVVGSHFEHSLEEKLFTLDDLNVTLLRRTASMQTYVQIDSNHSVFGLDCRRMGGGQLGAFIHALSNSLNVIRTCHSNREMSLYCHMLYEWFMKNDRNVYSLGSLSQLILNESSSVSFLPMNIEQIVLDLSKTGLIIFLKDDINKEKSWIVIDKSILLRKLNGILFAPKDFQKHNVVSNTGITSLTDLSSLFQEEKEIDPELLLKFLQYMHLGKVITEKIISISNLAPLIHDCGNTEEYIFIPALISQADKPVIEEPFEFGWCLQCVHHYHHFSPNFFHELLLCLAYDNEFAIEHSFDNKLERLCTVWNNGIFWNNMKGVQTLVEIDANRSCLILLMSFQHEVKECINEMIKLRRLLITTILTHKEKLCPETPVAESIMDKSSLHFPIKSLNSIPLYNIELLAKCYIHKELFIIDSSNHGKKLISLKKLFDHAPVEYHCHSIFVCRNPKDIANGNIKLANSGGEDLVVVHDQDAQPEGVVTDHASGHDTIDKRAFTILKSYTPKLLSLILYPEKLSDELWANDLLSDSVRDRIKTTKGSSRYDRVDMILEEMHNYVKLSNYCNDVFLKFCEVLGGHGDPGLTRLAKELQDTFELTAEL